MATVDYKLIKNFFSKEEILFLQNYCNRKLDTDKDYVIDHQSFSPAFDTDEVMFSFLDIKKSKVEEESNLKLFPTYAYWRYYIFGGSLKFHRDRPACEVSVTVCLKKHDKWPLVIENESVELEEGDGLLYAGCVQLHGRPGIYKGEGMAQAFFHYVDQSGPFTAHTYDRFRLSHLPASVYESPEDLTIKKNLIKEYKKEKKNYGKNR
jgi:hypothetical protein|tara:strand:- start:567 stop:1187 length:621 start_codon:yes stop_codon:yes gene_type:complete